MTTSTSLPLALLITTARDLNHVAVAVAGNLMRLMEAGYAQRRADHDCDQPI
ncbi:hypothetical protein [Gordonia sp. C13]|uniref:hypothetical protein n=1 Tax=Gordonia sp. C13 TaxID=2935078 RepID=UPI00200A6397|nr:hypothetical protein [Gordonia sp. C13]MCK8613967.1 hypothetical protein [Gordonia sp. C13]